MTMTQDTFFEKIEKVRADINFQDVANAIGKSHSTVHKYLAGDRKNEETMLAILVACKDQLISKGSKYLQLANYLN